MLYLFNQIFTNSELLLVKDLTSDYIKSLISCTEVKYDSTFDSSSVIDLATLDAANKLQKSFSSFGIQAKVGITRTFPRPNMEWRLVIENKRKIAGMNSFVASFLRFARMECHEILSFDEVMEFNNYRKY